MLFGSFYFRATRTIDGLMFLRERRFDAGAPQKLSSATEWLRLALPADYRRSGNKIEVSATSHASELILVRRLTKRS